MIPPIGRGGKATGSGCHAREKIEALTGFQPDSRQYQSAADGFVSRAAYRGISDLMDPSTLPASAGLLLGLGPLFQKIRRRAQNMLSRRRLCQTEPLKS